MLKGSDPVAFFKQGRPVPGDRKAKDYWELDERRNIEPDDWHWETEMKDTRWRLHSYVRWVFRVPHYKSGKELEAELQARKAKS